MAVRANVLRVDGSSEAETFAGDELPLAWLQEQVGGYIERVQVGTRTVFVNEEAAVRGLPVNPQAAKLLGDVPGSIDGDLRGDVVVLEPVH